MNEKLKIVLTLVALAIGGYNLGTRIIDAKTEVPTIPDKCAAEKVVDLYGLGYSKTKYAGKDCRVVYKYGMKCLGNISDALAYYDAFITRQLHTTNKESEIECFFNINTFEYKLISHTRTDSNTGTESLLYFQSRSCTPCNYYYKLRLLKATGDTYIIEAAGYKPTNWLRWIDNHFPNICCLLMIVVAIMTYAHKVVILDRRRFIEEEQREQYEAESSFAEIVSVLQTDSGEVETNVDMNEQVDEGLQIEMGKPDLEENDKELQSQILDEHLAETANPKHEDEASFEAHLEPKNEDRETRGAEHIAQNAKFEELSVVNMDENDQIKLVKETEGNHVQDDLSKAEQFKTEELVDEQSTDIGSDGSWYEIVNE